MNIRVMIRIFQIICTLIWMSKCQNLFSNYIFDYQMERTANRPKHLTKGRSVWFFLFLLDSFHLLDQLLSATQTALNPDFSKNHLNGKALLVLLHYSMLHFTNNHVQTQENEFLKVKLLSTAALFTETNYWKQGWILKWWFIQLHAAILEIF